MMRIVADLAKCHGIGMCEAMAPDLFEVGDDDPVEVLDDRPPESDRPYVKAAVDACPVFALTLRD